MDNKTNITVEFFERYPQAKRDLLSLLKTRYEIDISEELLDILIRTGFDLRKHRLQELEYFYRYCSKEFIELKGIKNLDIERLSMNNKIDSDLLRKNIDLNWNFEVLSFSAKLDNSIIQDYPLKGWSPVFLLCEKDISIEVIEKLPGFNDVFEDERLYTNDINPDFTDKYFDIVSKKIDRSSLSVCCSEKTILERSDYNWDYQSMSANPNISASFIEQNIEKMNVEELIYSKHIQYLIEKFPNLPWKYSELEYRTDLDIDFIRKHVGDSSILSYNVNLTEDYIRNHPEVKWNIGNILFQQKKTSIIPIFKDFEYNEQDFYKSLVVLELCDKEYKFPFAGIINSSDIVYKSL